MKGIVMYAQILVTKQGFHVFEYVL